MGIAKGISGQEIDGYLELQTDQGTCLDRDSLLHIIGRIWRQGSNEPDVVFSSLYQKYMARRCFLPSENLAPYKNLLATSLGMEKIRIGLEFETGNIASSFRAFSKLNSLFRLGKIDAGVFITSKDKSTTACRLWPVSNRNGSFEELEKRNIALPMFEFSFCPDGYSHHAPYLGSGGNTYFLIDQGRTKVIGGIRYRIFTGEKKSDTLLLESGSD